MTPLLLHPDVLQGSPEWLQLRCGKLTSSAADAVISLADLHGTKGKDVLKSRSDLIFRLACERISGEAASGGFRSDAMDWGTQTEPLAKLAYSEAEGVLVSDVGLIEWPEVGLATSPDGIVYDTEGVVIGGVEAKCPQATTHMEYRALGVGGRGEGPAAIPSAYLRQMLHHLYVVTTAHWWDFVSYHPAFPGRAQLYVARLSREAAQPLLDIYGPAVQRLLDEVAAEEQRLREEM